jgi:hypothetical protein
MANISITLYTNKFFGAVLKSPIQRGLLGVNNSVTNISILGTFKCVVQNRVKLNRARVGDFGLPGTFIAKCKTGLKD